MKIREFLSFCKKQDQVVELYFYKKVPDSEYVVKIESIIGTPDFLLKSLRDEILDEDMMNTKWMK